MVARNSLDTGPILSEQAILNEGKMESWLYFVFNAQGLKTGAILKPMYILALTSRCWTLRPLSLCPY